MSTQAQVNPGDLFRVLSDRQIEQIYQGSLEVLRETGVKIYSERAVKLLAEAGCPVSDDNLVRMPTSLVEQAIASAPSQIHISNRRGEPAMMIGGHLVYYGPGEGPTFVLDPYTNERRPFLRSDARNMARLCDALPNIDFLMGLGSISDTPVGMGDLYELEAMLSHSTKPVVIWANSAENMRYMYKMGVAIAGGEERFSSNPFMIFNTQINPPLCHSRESVEKALFAAEKRVPLIYTPSPSAGATAPVTLAGLLVNSLAECLSGVVITQVASSGTPIITGGGISVMDMTTTILSYGAPELALASAALVEIARYLNLPVATTGGCTDSKVMDGQAALEATFNLLMAGLSGANLVRDIGYFESGMTSSGELLVLCDEIIGMVKRIVRGVGVDDERLAVDLIHKVGPGGNFLTEKHTFKHFRNEVWYPRLLDRQMYHKWVEQGSLTLSQRLNLKTRELLDSHAPEPLPADVEQSLREILAEAESRLRVP